MNLISFTNFTNTENPNAFLPSAEKEGKGEDFSTLLNNIGLALQNIGSPPAKFSNGFEQMQTFSQTEQNFVVGNAPALPENLSPQVPVLISNTGKTVSSTINSIQPNSAVTLDLPINLPLTQSVEETIHISSLKAEILNSAFKIEPGISFTPTENLVSIPTNFQPFPKFNETIGENLTQLPQINSTAVETPGFQSDKIESLNPQLPQIESLEFQSAQIEPLKLHPDQVESLKLQPSETKDFEILSDDQENNIPLKQHISSALLSTTESETNQNQAFEQVRESGQSSEPVKETSLKEALPVAVFEEIQLDKTQNIQPALPTTEAITETVKSALHDAPEKENILSSESLIYKNTPPDLPSELTNLRADLPSDLQSETNLPTQIKLADENTLQPSSALENSAPVPFPTSNQTAQDIQNLPVVLKTDFVSKRGSNLVDESDTTGNYETEVETISTVEKSQDIISSQPVKSDFRQNIDNEALNEKITANLPSLSAKSLETPEIHPPDIEINSFPAIQEKIFSVENESIVFNQANENSSQSVLTDKNPLNSHPALPNLSHSKTVQIKLPTEESVTEKSNEFDLKDSEISGLLDKFLEKANLSPINKEKAVNNPESFQPTVKNPFQPLEINANQTAETELSQTIQIEKPIKSETIETDFFPKIEKEIKLKESENNSPLIFDKVIEKFTKEAKFSESNASIQTESPEIDQQISPHLLELAMSVEKNQEKEILKMRLHPAELGTVEITLEKDNSGVLNAQFKTENADAQQALSKGLEQLRDNLQNAGWEVGKMDISNSSTSTTDNQHRQNNQQKSEWIENFAFNRSAEQPDETENNSPTRLLNLQA